LKEQLEYESRRILFKEKERIHINENTVRLLDPKNVLKRGYSLTLKEGAIVKTAKQLNPEDEIETRFADGSVKSKITKGR
jgi:exodeoxyribonuclease VII large subunit